MLKEFFQPISSQLMSTLSKSDGYLGKKCLKHLKSFPELKPGMIVFFGLDKTADEVRKSFYQLSDHFPDIEIADLGNLKIIPESKDALAGYSELFYELNALNIQPVCLGKDHLILTAFLDVLTESVSPDVCLFTNKLSQPEKLMQRFQEQEALTKLFHLSLLGHQTHYNLEEDYQLLDPVFTDSLRLGMLQSDLSKAEPLIREAHLSAFDLSIIRSSDFQSSSNNGPNGLYSEEACKLMRYVGIANQSMPLIIHHYIPQKSRPQDADLVAQLIWYFLDGIQNRYADNPDENDAEFNVIRCPVDGMPIPEITFLKSAKSERIWMEIPLELTDSKRNSKWIGCSETELEIAAAGEVPEKWFRAIGWKSI